MFSHNPPLHAGQDPRAWTEYTQLRDEMSKLTHPARPDIAWQQVEQWCVTLFRHNGTDLQTAAWFCFARVQRAGLSGLSEGLDLLDSLISHQWSLLWPSQLPSRKAVLVWLSEHLMLSLRGITLGHRDRQTVYRLEQQLRHLCDLLQRLDLRQVSKFDALLHWMHAAVVRLENAKETPLPAPAETSSYMASTLPESAGRTWGDSEPVVLVVRDEGTQRIAQTSIVKRYRRGVWMGFTAGMMSAALVTTLSLWGWLSWQESRPAARIGASLTPLPVALSSTEQTRLIDDDAGALQSQGRSVTERTRRQLDAVVQLSPVWAQEYGFALVAQTQRLWPHQPETEALAKQWWQQVEANALPDAHLQGWHQAMEQLQVLTNKLNSTDMQRGKYLTVSELKSSVFAITQTLNRNEPIEEQLRQLEQQKKESRNLNASQQQAEQGMTQLLNRYAIITRAQSTPG